MRRNHYPSLLVFCMLICFSCNNKRNSNIHSEKNDYEIVCETIEQTDVDLPIGVNLVPHKDEYGTESGKSYPNAFMYFKVTDETKDLLEIEPNSSYYNLYASNKTMYGIVG